MKKILLLDRVTPVGAIIFVTFPKLKDGTGFTSPVGFSL
jgi:hypothetical protein